MKLQTTINIKPLKYQISYKSRLFAIGSCFAQRIGDAMKRSKFNITTNPTGVLFNPLSISSTLKRLKNKEFISINELHEGEMGWFHYDFHSSLNGATAEDTLAQINSCIEQAHEALKQSEGVIITLGTAWIYELADSMRLVANCHKQPARKFIRRRISVEEAYAAIKQIVDALPDKQIILTLSPIRHLADGACDNAVSKATLRLAIEQACEEFPNIEYFPAYEIVLDELRDYRFYGDDMVHPSSIAVEYIWERFCDSALSAECRTTLEKVMRIVKAAEHRPYNSQSDAHLRHCAAQIRAIETLSEVEFRKEYEYFSGCLKINL